MRVLIVDDIIEIRDHLAAMLHQLEDQIEIIYQMGSVAEASDFLKTKKVDLLFLDVELSDGTGMELLDQISTMDFQLVFMTAHEKYAIEAFRFSAIDFLLKPISLSDVSRVLEKTRESQKVDLLEEQLKVLKGHLNADMERVVLRNSDAIYFVKIKDIVQCESQGSYTKFILSNEKPILISKGLKEFDQMFNPLGFIRSHQSHLINPNHIVRWDRSDGGCLIMSNGNNVPVSSRKKQYILELFNL